jgi:hypothetical protein
VRRVGQLGREERGNRIGRRSGGTTYMAGGPNKEVDKDKA